MYLVRPSYLLKKLYSGAVWRKEKNRPFIYLTFDDGPVPEITPWVLDVLKQKNITATFFCVGENIQKHPHIYERVINENHRVGNHTYNHIDGWKWPTEKYLNNVKQCNNAMHPPASAKALFRPPYGKIKPSQLNRLSKQYEIVMWDVLSGDYDKNTSAEKCLKNVIKNYRNGSIVVFHDSFKAQRNMQYALPLFIDHALKAGFEFKRL